MQFVNRVGDLRHLEGLASSPGPVLYRLTGRRRIGKTALLEQMLRRHDGVYLFAPDGEESRILAELRRQAAQESGEEVLPPEGWHGLFRFLERFEGRPIVLDEFQHVIESSATAVSLLQEAWDRRLKDGNHKLFLCGSSIGMMRRLTTGRKGPLFGRLTHDQRLGPFAYRDVTLLYPGLSAEDVLDRYAVFGGTPAYHRAATGRPGTPPPTLETGVRTAFLDPTAPFREEPLELLRFELKKPARYNAILESIGAGRGTMTEIADRLDLRTTDLTRYIEYLRDDLGLIAAERRVPHHKRRTRYVFTDPFFDFYYRFIAPGTALIERGAGDRVWDTIKAGLPDHRGRVAERLVMDLFDDRNGDSIKDIPIQFADRGRWWGPKPGDRTQIEELDLVAVGRGRFYVAEVKWRSEPLAADAWDRLEAKLALVDVPTRAQVHRVLVSRSGFTPRCRDGAPEGSILLDGAEFLALLGAPAPAPSPVAEDGKAKRRQEETAD